MSRLARPSTKNTSSSSTSNPPTISNTPASNTSNNTNTMRPITRNRTVSTQSSLSIRPPSRLNQLKSTSSRTTISRKKSSPVDLSNTNNNTQEVRRSQTESNEPHDQLPPTQVHPPGANIKVVVRCRGLTDSERAADPQVVLLTGGIRGRELTVDLNSHPSPSEVPDQPHARDIHPTRDDGPGLSNADYGSSLVDDPKRSANIKVYPFDHVFGPEADQALIFTDVVAPILTEVLQGYNCTIFAYGQTGTGKTYTMTGDLSIPTATTILPTAKIDSGPASPLGLSYDSTPLVIPTSLRKFTNEAGIIPRVLHSLFNMLEDCSEEEKVEFGVKVSFVELYNEELRDLNYPESTSNSELNPPSVSTNLKIFEDPNPKKGPAGGSGVYIQNLTETSISSAKEGIKILTLGSSRRQIAATKCNEQSSRSHSVFSITIHVKDDSKDGKDDQLKIGKLNLVDLAGSENVGRSGAGKEFGRAREAGMINQSLLTLGRVINALVEKSSHVPYRESKLTRLLQDSLGGKTKTCIIATVSPSRVNLEETLSTLDYALRAKSIKNRPELNNKINKAILINQYVTEIEKLRHDLIATRTKNGIYFSEERWGELMKDSETKNRALIESKRKIELVELELISVKKEFEKCLRILNVREGEIAKIQDELTRKSALFDDLTRVKEALDDQLSEERALKEKLSKSRIKWKNQCKEVYEDNEGLRDKIARKAAVESFNQNTLKEVDQSLASSAAVLKTDLKEFGTQSNLVNQEIKSMMDEMEHSLVNGMKTNQDVINEQIEGDLKSIMSNITESMGDIQAKLMDGFIHPIQSDVIPNELVRENQTHLNDLIQNLEVDKLAKIQAILDQIKSDACEFLTSTKESIQSSFALIHDKLDEDRENLIKFHEIEKADLKEEAARLRKEMELLKQNAEEEVMRAEEDEKEIVELIQRQFRSNHKRKLAQSDALLQSLTDLEERKDRKRLRLDGFQKDFDQSRAGFQAEFHDTLGSVNGELDGFESTFAVAQSSLFDNLSSDQRERISSYTARCKKIESVGETLDQNCDELLSDFNLFKQVLDQQVARIDKQVLGVHHQKLTHQINSQIKTVESSVNQVLNDVERQASMSNGCIDKSMGLITNLRNEIHSYLKNEIRKDEITGQTPRRKKLMVERNPMLEQAGPDVAACEEAREEAEDEEEAEEADEDEDRSDAAARPRGLAPHEPVLSEGPDAAGPELPRDPPPRDQTDDHHVQLPLPDDAARADLPPPLLSKKRKNHFKSASISSKPRSVGILRDKPNQSLR